jgi:hypothetical protein
VVEAEIEHGPGLALALRARRTLLMLATALGCAAAGATVIVAAQRGAREAYIAHTYEPPSAPDCVFWNSCSGSWWEWPDDKSPLDSPPTAILGPQRRQG